MILRVLYFASLREGLNVSEEEVELPDGSKGSDLVDHLSKRGPLWSELLAESGNVRLAVNQEFADMGDSLSDGDEVALFPPVTGG